MPPSLVPPFTLETAKAKVQFAQDAWNSRDPHRVVKGYSEDSVWRNRDQQFTGHAEIVKFLTQKWSREHSYRLRKELFAFTGNRIAVEFWYEFHDDAGQWFRAYGIEHWTFGEDGLMKRRQMSANNVAIAEEDRWFKGGVDVNDVDIEA